MEANEQIQLLKELLEKNYYVTLLEKVRKGESFLVVDFLELTRFNPELAEKLLEEPEEVLKAGEIAVKEFELPKEVSRFHVRFRNLPLSAKMLISDIRSIHLNKFMWTEGIVRRKTDVRPHVTAVRFECPSCGNILTIVQLEKKYKEPSRCSCGRKGKFKEVDKELVDAQAIVIEEAPEDLEGGEQPKRINVLLKNDLVSSLNERKSSPGTKVRIVGWVSEVPIHLRSGGQSTKFDLLFEANHMEMVEEDYSNIIITKEEEDDIKKLSADPKAMERIVASIAPSIYGYEKVKEALAMQLVGGVRKERADGVVSRGDSHILLIGDAGVGKCLAGETTVVLSDGSQKKIMDIVEPLLGNEQKKDVSFLNVSVVTFNAEGRSESRKIRAVSKRKTSKLLSIKTEQGTRIRTTPNHPFFTLEECRIVPKSAEELDENEFVAVPRFLSCQTNMQPLPQAVPLVKAHNGRHITLPPYCTEEAARFLGYLVGDGYCAYTKTSGWATLTGNDGQLLEDFTAIAQKLFAVSVARRAAHSGKSAQEAHITSRELTAYLETLSPELLKGARKKCIPECIIKSPPAVIAAFIKALFDCDGTVSRQKREVSLASASCALVEHLRLLLRRFGISSQISKTYKCATNTVERKKGVYYSITLSGENVALFADYIGFSLKRKQLAIRQVLQQFQQEERKANSNLAVVPNLGKALKQLRMSLGLSQSLMGIPRTTYEHYEHGTRNPTYPSLHKVLAACERFATPITPSAQASAATPLIQQFQQQQCEALMHYAHMKLLAESHVGWEKIKKIETQDVDEWVYDLEVEETSNFVANGFLVHNSQLLKRMVKVAPKARYTSGKGVSGAGLTASVIKDEFLGGWSLEAGAMVLANKGFLMIDELDKMSKEDRSALHESLEQQSVSISKANIQATLRAETTVLAAANPKFGRFDPYGVIADQIDLPPTLINRFDLIFPIKDLPDKIKDEKMASHILALHQKPEEGKGEIHTPMLRKYFAYARQNCKPAITDGAMEELKEYYIKVRNKRSGEEGIHAVPITARQLEALVRLAEASAKLRLSDKVTRKDAKRAIELLNYSLSQVAMDIETGEIDIDRISTGISASQRNKIGMVKEAMAELEEATGQKVLAVEQLVDVCKKKGVKEEEVEEILEKLRRSGDVFEPRRGFVQKL